MQTIESNEGLQDHVDLENPGGLEGRTKSL